MTAILTKGNTAIVVISFDLNWFGSKNAKT